MGSETPSRLEQTVKGLLHDRSLSMRQLARLTGIHVATISKMLAGKQRINPEYLQRIAEHLAVAPGVLFAAAGFDVLHTVATPARDFDHIGDIIRRLGFEAVPFDKESVLKELIKYEGYAQTQEGRSLIIERFPRKRQEIAGSGPFIDDLDEMFARYTSEDVKDAERTILGSGLLYFVLSTDAIPDFLFPIGYLDDALAISLTWERLRHWQAAQATNADS